MKNIGGYCVGFNLRRASRSVSRLYDAALAPTGLRTTQFSALVALRMDGPLTVSVLAERLSTERTTLTRNLGLLERMGLVRSDNGSDRREHHVGITEQGASVLDAALPYWEKVQAVMEGALGKERIDRILADIADLVEVARAELSK